MRMTSSSNLLLSMPSVSRFVAALVVAVCVGIPFSTTFVVVSAAEEGAGFEAGSVVTNVVALGKGNLNVAIQDSANPLWLLKFYAPWCGHCKKLAPVLQQVARQVQGKMAIGTIDCTVEKAICNEHGIRGYPTLKYAIDGTIHDYPGGRSAKEFIYFAEKLSRFAIEEVNNVEDLTQALAKKTEEGVAFVAFHPHVQGDTIEEKLQSSLLTQVFAQVARKEMAMASFFLVNAAVAAGAFGNAGDKPLICRIEDNVAPRCYEKVDSSVELNDLHKFVQEQNVATVAKLGAQNFHKVGRRGKPLVIGVVDADSDEQVQIAKRELSRYALTGPDDIRQNYYYAYMDGKAFQRFLEQFDLRPEDTPQVFILNVPDRTFWQNATYKLNVDDFIAAVQDGTISSRNAGKSGMEGALVRLYHAIVEYRPWSVIIIVLLVIFFLMAILSVVSPGEDLRPPYRPEDIPPAPRTTSTGSPKKPSGGGGGGSGSSSSTPAEKSSTNTSTSVKEESKTGTEPDESKKDK